MATHLQKPGSDVNAWGLVHNDFHKTLLGGYEYIDIQLNANKPPTIKQYSRFSVYKTDNSYTIPNGTATGNNNYPMNTTPTYNLTQAIFEDSADVTFDWGAATRGETVPAQSDGVWYIYCKNCLDTDASTKGQGVYNVSKTETPTFSVQKGGWYSANGYRVLGEFTSSSGTVSNLYVYRGSSPIEKGLFQGKGFNQDTTSLYMYPYEIEVNGKIYSSASTTTTQAWSGLAANTWYGFVMSEATGIITVVTLGSGWTGYTISTNSINLLSIYDSNYGYCRALRSGVWFRLLIVFKSNATPNSAMFSQVLYGVPKSGVNAYRGSAQTIGTGSPTTILYATEEFDYNSEYDGGTGIFTASGAKQVTATMTATPNAALASGKRWSNYLVATNHTSGLSWMQMSCGATPSYFYTTPAVKQFSLAPTDTIRGQVNHDKGSNQDTSTVAAENSLQV